MVRYNNNLADVVEKVKSKILRSELDEKRKATEIANLIISFSNSNYQFYIYMGRIYDYRGKSYAVSEFDVEKKGKYWSKAEIKEIYDKYKEKVSNEEKKRNERIERWNKELEKIRRLYSPW